MPERFKKIKVKDFEKEIVYSYTFEDSLVSRIRELANRLKTTDIELISDFLGTMLVIAEEVEKNGSSLILRDSDGNEEEIDPFNSGE